MNQKGGILLEKADGNQLEIKNIRCDVGAGIVTGVVTTTDPEGGAIMRDFVNVLGQPADGGHFGTAVLN